MSNLYKPPASRANGGSPPPRQIENGKGRDDGKNKHGNERNPNRHKGYEHPKETFLDAGGDVLDEGMEAMEAMN